MLAFLALGISLLGHFPISTDGDEAKGMKVEYSTFGDYFEKNTSGLKGEASYLVFTDRDAFDKVFALRPPLMGKKSVGLPANAFEKKLVVAAIERGNAITTYKVEKVSLDEGTLYVQYKATAGKPTSATFASPLILTADKGKIKSVVFIEDGKKVVTVEVK